jgi:hypothetical protein
MSDETRGRTQRDGIDRLIKAGALPSAAGPMMLPVPSPQDLRPAAALSENGPCGNPGDWCSSNVFVTLPGWKCKLCGSCDTEWLKAVGSL